MKIDGLVLVVLIVAGFVGLGARTYIASVLTSEESIDSNDGPTRYVFRALLSMFYYLVSLVVVALCFWPLMKELLPEALFVRRAAVALAALPLAYVLTRLGFWRIRSVDEKKRRGWDRLKRR